MKINIKRSSSVGRMVAIAVILGNHIASAQPDTIPDTMTQVTDSMYVPVIWNPRPGWIPDETFTTGLYGMSIALTSPYNIAGAKHAIREKSAKILFPGGFGGMPHFNNPADKAFQQKYHVAFFSQGCMHIEAGEDEEGYNRTVFDWLDKTYGNAWRHELRKDAIAFEPPVEIVAAVAELPVDIRPGPERSKPANPRPSPRKSGTSWLLPVGIVLALVALAIWFLQRKKRKQSLP